MTSHAEQRTTGFRQDSLVSPFDRLLADYGTARSLMSKNTPKSRDAREITRRTNCTNYDHTIISHLRVYQSPLR